MNEFILINYLRDASAPRTVKGIACQDKGLLKSLLCSQT